MKAWKLNEYGTDIKYLNAGLLKRNMEYLDFLQIYYGEKDNE
jgi:hypothetical protein